MSKPSGAEAVNVRKGIVLVVNSNYSIATLSRVLPSPNHRFYIDRSYGNDLVKYGSIQCEQ